MTDRLAYTVAEFARLIGRKPVTIQRWLMRGELAGRKLGGAWVIPADALSGTMSPDAQPPRGQPVPAEAGRSLGASQRPPFL